MGNKQSSKPSNQAGSAVGISTAPPESALPAASTLGSFLFPYLVTSIDVVFKEAANTSKYGEGATYVEFDGKIEADPNDTDVVYLLKVKEIGVNSSGKPVYGGISVSQTEFVERIVAEDKKLLACVHGFQTDPEKWMAQCMNIQEDEGFEHIVIPVVWPSVGSVKGVIDLTLKYDEEQKIALQAGKALSSIADVGLKTDLSLMCHSMGNRVMFSFAREADVRNRFENIFMVAADVWEEVFNHRVIADTWWQPPWNYANEWKDTGLKVCGMVKESGKIHILHYPNDVALLGSEYGENWKRRRIGRYGKAGQEGRIHEDCVDKLVDVDFTGDEVKETDRVTLHAYHDSPKAIAYYSSVMNA